MTDPDDRMLDDLFAQARAQAPQPDDALMARVLADAAEQSAPVSSPVSSPIHQPGFWARLSDALGGWPALGGLAAATVAGVWVGIAPPAGVEDLAASLIGDTVSVTLLSPDTIFDAGDLADG